MDIVVPKDESCGYETGFERLIKVDVRRAGREVLKALEKWGMMSQAQVEGLIFGEKMTEEERVNLFFDGVYDGKFDAPGYKVLKRLREAEMVRLHGFLNASLYALTGRGHGYMIQRGISIIPGRRLSMAPSMVPHEMLVTGIGLVMSSLLGLPVSTEFERYARSRYAKGGAQLKGMILPDLWISDAAQPKAVEVERTMKDSERYRRLWTDYRSSLPPEVVVLYITAWPNGAEIILSRARELLMDFIYVCSIEDFKKSLGTCPFVGYRGGEIRLEKRIDHPQFPHYQRVPFAPPRQSIRIGELIRPASQPDQSAAPLEMRKFPRPHPLTPSPSPEGEDTLQGKLR
jgi:hypothetical protein